MDRAQVIYHPKKIEGLRMVITTEASELGPLIPQVTAQPRCTGAPVLLMDEPTSALDGESEERFGKCLTFKE